MFIPGLTFAFRSVLAHSAIMEVRALGGDDFGISPEGLQAVAEAMAKVSADSEEHHSDSDIWNGVKEMLYHTAAFVDAAGTDKDAVAAYCFRSLLKATSTYNDEQTPKLLQHPKYADQLLIQCWVPAFGDSSQRSLRWAYALATELRYARKYLRVLVWLLSRAPGRTRESTWAKLSYNWLLQAETAMLQKRQNGLTASWPRLTAAPVGWPRWPRDRSRKHSWALWLAMTAWPRGASIASWPCDRVTAGSSIDWKTANSPDRGHTCPRPKSWLLLKGLDRGIHLKSHVFCIYLILYSSFFHKLCMHPFCSPFLF